ncbi:hypothetical protein H1164_13105 [Thermoactinomyces daqus]|uniref:Uncharacterized protein n=1 Tax=Thermoactinomyces daqus TaxID=1329516 RepID=A0A7W2AIJ6_9BACL|nr:hypothetical protein [Thermoactinomyces daqus]MBA4543826.1 hypothetical protein [Thermoactinomyces daqus]
MNETRMDALKWNCYQLTRHAVYLQTHLKSGDKRQAETLLDEIMSHCIRIGKILEEEKQ